MTQDKNNSKLKMHSPDLTQDNIAKLADLFPNCVTETRDEQGQLKQSIDFDQLRQELSDHIVEGPQERYRLDWPGKREAMLAANAPVAKTLRPCREESVDFDNTQNLFIEGDNLESLKLLQEGYLNKVSLIYIDPPYNTGNDLIYNDDFAETKNDYFYKSYQQDEQGNRLVANSEGNGRFHSDWLSMMYSRLKLAKSLLSEEGLIFISIGPEEVFNLKNIMDEIFGEYNFRNAIAIKRGTKSVQAQFDTWEKLGNAFEYILLYSKKSTYRIPKMLKELDEYKQGSWNNHWRGTNRPTMRYELFGIKPNSGQWRWGKERSMIAKENYKKMLYDIGKDENEITQQDIDNWYINQDTDLDLLRLSSKGKPEHYIPPSYTTLLNDVWFHISGKGSSEVKSILGVKVFNNPKSKELIKQICKFKTNNSIVMDFFAGTGTSAHALMELNAENGSNNQYIMVQLPEYFNEGSEAYNIGYHSVSQICKERIRRAGNEILKYEYHENWNKDIGFRVLKVDSTNMKDVFYTPDRVTQKDLFGQVDNIKKDRSEEDLLFQVLLDWGVDLTLPIQSETISNKNVYFVDQDALAACFEADIDKEFVKQLAEKKPLRAVFRDTGFGSDSTKINVEQIFKLISPTTEVKTI